MCLTVILGTTTRDQIVSVVSKGRKKIPTRLLVVLTLPAEPEKSEKGVTKINSEEGNAPVKPE